MHWSKLPNSEEVKRKLSETRKRLFREGKLKPNKTFGLIPWNKGLTKADPRVLKNTINGHKTRKIKDNYKHSPETIIKIQKSVKKIIKEGKGNPFKEKEKNISWNGGTSFEPYGLEFNTELKLLIRKRDNFTCQECNQTEEQLGHKLSVHHIDYDKKNNNPENLITLCKSCHSQTNFDRNDWVNYFQEKIK